MALAMEWPSAVDGVAVGFRASGAFFAFVHFWPNCCYNKPVVVCENERDGLVVVCGLYSVVVTRFACG